MGRERGTSRITHPSSRLTFGVVAVALVGAMLTGSANGLPASEAGGTAAVGPKAGGGASCAVLGPNGTEVTQVPAMSFGDPAFFLLYSSSGALARNVQFITRPTFEGSPALVQVQKFNTDFSNNVTTPFGVPDWGGNKTSGPWTLEVRDSLGRSAVCPFEIVP